MAFEHAIFLVGTLLIIGACSIVLLMAWRMMQWGISTVPYLQRKFDEAERQKGEIMAKLQDVAWSECAAYSREREALSLYGGPLPSPAAPGGPQTTQYNKDEVMSQHEADLKWESAESGIPLDALRDLYERAAAGELTDNDIKTFGDRFPARLAELADIGE